MKRIKTPIKEIELRISENKSEVLKIPEYVFELNEEELNAIRNTIEPFRSQTEIFDIIGGDPIPDLAFCWDFKAESYTFLKVIDIINNIAYLHTVITDVLTWTKRRFLIGDFALTDPQTQDGVKILSLEAGVPSFISHLPIYDSLPDLKQNDLFRRLTDRQKQNVIKETNIQRVTDLIFTKMNYRMNPDFVQHLYFGTLKKGKASGVHHIKPILRGFVEVVEIVKPQNKQGVWEAKIRLLDGRYKRNSKVKRWKEKDDPSTFFPNQWNSLTLLQECNFAFENKLNPSQKGRSLKWESTTKSGIPVEIWTDENEEITSIYPIWIPD